MCSPSESISACAHRVIDAGRAQGVPWERLSLSMVLAGAPALHPARARDAPRPRCGCAHSVRRWASCSQCGGPAVVSSRTEVARPRRP